MVHDAGLRPFSNVVSSYLMFICTQIVFEVFSRKEYTFDPTSQANDLAEANGRVSETEEAAAEVWDRLAHVEEALQYVTCLYLEHAISVLANNALYTKRTNREKWIIYELQIAKLPKVFDFLPDSVVAALGTMKPDPLIRAIVELDEQ